MGVMKHRTLNLCPQDKKISAAKEFTQTTLLFTVLTSETNLYLHTSGTHSAVPWMTLEYTKKGLGVGIKQFYLALFPTNTYQTTIWSEISSICIFSETVQVLLNDLCDWIVYLDLAETSNEWPFQRVRIRFRFMSTAMWCCDIGSMAPDIVPEYQDQFAHWKSITTQKAWILNNTAVKITSLQVLVIVPLYYNENPQIKFCIHFYHT